MSEAPQPLTMLDPSFVEMLRQSVAVALARAQDSPIKPDEFAKLLVFALNTHAFCVKFEYALTTKTMIDGGTFSPDLVDRVLAGLSNRINKEAEAFGNFMGRVEITKQPRIIN